MGIQVELNKKIYLSRELISYENIINDDTSYLVSISSINKSAHYLCCSIKTIQRSLDLGYIYVPTVFLPYLNNKFLNSHNSIKEYLDKSKFEYNLYNLGSKIRKLKIKSNLYANNNNLFTKLYIKGI